MDFTKFASKYFKSVQELTKWVQDNAGDIDQVCGNPVMDSSGLWWLFYVTT
jgi:hypothetical protein